MTTKILLAIPYWRGDRLQAEKVAGLLCDLRDEITEQAQLMFVTRYDSPPPSAAIQLKAQMKFEKVHVWKCNRKGLGFPGGCNELAYGLFNYILTQRHMNTGFKDITTILILESDCVVLRKTYIEELVAEWEKAQTIGKSVVGALQDKITWKDGEIQEHINAAAMYDAEITRIIPCLIGGPNQTGWDHYHGPAVIPHSVNSKLFKLDYRKPTITAEELFKDPEILVYHGVKDDSAIAAVKAKFQIK